MNPLIQSFPPVLGGSPKVLILGTMPGKESLRLQQYYAFSRNTFWKIVFTLHQSPLLTDYALKTAFLIENNIALWDVCHTALRKTSLDADIREETPNDLFGLVKENPTIKLICFNGQGAAKLYAKYFDQFPGIRYVTLLSTSPANASYTFEQKLADWKIILNP